MARRILHVVGNMNIGGIQTWLMQVLRTIDRQRYRMDFLIRTDARCTFDDEIRALGSRIIPCRDRRRPWRLARILSTALRTHGPYDVVHSHVGPSNALVMQISAWHRVPLRVAHSHVDNRAGEARRGWSRRVYLQLTQRMVWRYASVRLAASGAASEFLFGRSWQRDERNRILYCGVDFAPFERAPERSVVRRALGLPLEALVIGHVGRFDRQKNQEFLLEIVAVLARRRPDARLVLVGDGELRQTIEARARERGLGERVVFCGVRSDVPQLMRGAMDIFLFPSRSEGLGLALIEAQAAGLPCVVSDVVPDEADVIPSLIRRLSLAAPAAEWAKTILRIAGAPPAITRERALQLMRESPFALEDSVERLTQVYDLATAAEG